MTTIEIPGAAARPRLSARWPLLIASLGGVAVLVGLAVDRDRTWADLLVDGFYFLSLALAGALILAIHYLASAGWWVALRRIPEAMMACLPAAVPMLLGLWFGRLSLYSWARPGAADHDPVLAAKATYLSAPGFFLRMAVILALWLLFTTLMRRASRSEDAQGGTTGTAPLAAHRRLVWLSAGFVPLFAVTFSLASFDWLMSLQPHWYSTIFAVYVFAALLLHGLAAVTLGAVSLSRPGRPLAGILREDHLHDLGKLLFGFSTFWAYIWVSQYLLIWYGNLSEEIPYYLARTRGAWLPLFALVLVLNWLVPFLALMTRAAKRNPATLRWVALVVLLGGWLDLYVMVGPPVLGRPRLGLLELAVTAGYAAVFLLLATRALGRAAVVPAQDPYLGESLSYHGG